MDADILIGPVSDPYMTMLGSHFLWRDGYGIPINVHTREELINKLRRVQLIFASEASQADAFHLSASGSSSGRLETIGIGRPIEVRNCTLLSKDQAQKER